MLFQPMQKKIKKIQMPFEYEKISFEVFQLIWTVACLAFRGKKAETSFILYTLISDEFLFEKKYFWLFWL
jgi:hypothetical protein